MKILVLGTAEQKEELLTFPADAAIEITWIAAPDHSSSYGTIDACIDLLFENNNERIAWLKQLNASLIVINSVVTSLHILKENFIRINGWNTFLKRPIIEAAVTNEELKEKATALFSLLGRQTEWVADVPGFITARVVACIINEAYMTLEEKVSVEEEVDTAMKMGTNYPYGPFEWSRKIGLVNVFHLLETLSKEQILYKPCNLLQQNALA
ncbi:MAG: 3-hydroxyacyl-CoA dehydrogenase family protein [Chitinophagaceae bacterium]